MVTNIRAVALQAMIRLQQRRGYIIRRSAVARRLVPESYTNNGPKDTQTGIVGAWSDTKLSCPEPHHPIISLLHCEADLKPNEGSKEAEVKGDGSSTEI